MAAADELVRRILSRSGIRGASARRDLERELRAHLEDAAEAACADGADGADEAGIPGIVARRFGDPDEIAAQFERLHRFDRRAARLGDAIVLLATSTMAVAALILAIQLLIAVRLGVAPADAFPRLRAELVAFVSLAFGYMGVYLGEGVFRSRRLWKALGASCALFTCMSAVASALGWSAPLAAFAFVGGAAVRILQRTALRKFWWVATLGPPTLTWLLAGNLMGGANPAPVWLALPVRWAGLTLACYSLTLLSRNHEVRHRTIE